MQLYDVRMFQTLMDLDLCFEQFEGGSPELFQIDHFDGISFLRLVGFYGFKNVASKAMPKLVMRIEFIFTYAKFC